MNEGIIWNDAKHVAELTNLTQAIQCIEESNKARNKENPRQEELAIEKDQNEKGG